MKNRKGMAKSTKVGLVVALVFLAIGGFAWWNGNLNLDSSGSSGRVISSSSDDSVGVNLNPSIQPSVGVNPTNVFNQSVLAGGTFTFYKGGVKDSDTSTPFNVPAGKSYEVLYDDSQHYQSQFKGSAPLSGEDTIQLDMYPNATLTTTFYNSAGTAATAQALGADEVKTVKVLLAAQTKKYFSHPLADKDIMVCFDYNTTEIDSIKVVGSGGSPKVPQQYTGTAEECWFSGIDTLSNGGEATLKLDVDTDTSVNPVTDATMYILDQDLTIKTQTDAAGTLAPGNVGDRVFNVENDAGSDIGGVNPSVTLDFS